MSESTTNFSGCGMVNVLARNVGEWLNQACARLLSTSSTNLMESQPWVRPTVSSYHAMKVPSLERLSEASCEVEASSTDTSLKPEVTKPPKRHHKEKARDEKHHAKKKKKKKKTKQPSEHKTTESLSSEGSTSSVGLRESPRHHKRHPDSTTHSKKDVSSHTYSYKQTLYGPKGVETTVQLPQLMLKFSTQQPMTIAYSKTKHMGIMPSQHAPSVVTHAKSATSYVGGAEDSSAVPSDVPEDVGALNKLTVVLQASGARGHGHNAEFSDFELECLKIHNEYREKHAVPPLTLNKEMCELARVLALALCGKATLPHFPDRKYGEIILVSKTKQSVPIQEACQKWYEQIENYEFGVEPKATKSRKNIKCHFTQMIWRSTKELGVGTAHDGDSTNAVVALYYPAGNIAGQYVQNCPRPQDWCTIDNIDSNNNYSSYEV